MATEKREVVLFGPAKPTIVKGLETACIVYKAVDAGDRDAFIAEHASVRAIACAQGQMSASLLRTFSKTRDRFQLRRRLRPCRCQICGRAWHHRHQHARSSDRGSGRHRARPSAVHRARATPGRAVRARRPMGDEGLSAERGDLAQPHRRHCRHGRHRPGHRAAARRFRRAGRLSQPQAAAGSLLPALSKTRRHGARRRHADGHRAGRRCDGQHDQCRGARRARTERHRHQHGARLGGR